MTFRAGLVLFSVLLSACQLLGGGTQVRFLNSTTFVLATIQLGPLVDNSSLASMAETSYFSIVPGQNVLTAESRPARGPMGSCSPLSPATATR